MPIPRPISARPSNSRVEGSPRPSNDPERSSPPSPLDDGPGRGEKLTKRDQQLRDDLAQNYTMIGVIVGLVRTDLGHSIVGNGEDAADQWIVLAQRNPRVRRALEDFTTASVWAGIISVHVKMFSPLVPGLVMGGSTPEPAPQAYTVGPGGEVVPPDEVAKAVDWAMSVMSSQQPTGTGGPTDTVTVDGAPIGSADFVPPPLDPSQFPFPTDATPAKG